MSQAFDPFGDIEQRGYLRNVRGDSDPAVVARMEHNVFRAGIGRAVANLASVRDISYADIRETHRILFSPYYPWAGSDRSVTAPDKAVSRGGVVFSHPMHSALAVEEGLRVAARPGGMRHHPGEVLGMFAYAHPFLDGNGRTILLVHHELCRRAGFSISWGDVDRDEYLAALGEEISTPARGMLDSLLLPHVAPPIELSDIAASVPRISEPQPQARRHDNGHAVPLSRKSK